MVDFSKYQKKDEEQEPSKKSPSPPEDDSKKPSKKTLDELFDLSKVNDLTKFRFLAECFGISGTSRSLKQYKTLIRNVLMEWVKSD